MCFSQKIDLLDLLLVCCTLLLVKVAQYKVNVHVASKEFTRGLYARE